MLARVLTLRFDGGRAGLDDTALRDFVPSIRYATGSSVLRVSR